jgi:predicted transcriptional regulator
MRRKSKKEPLHVTSFRLPPDVKAFLRSKADADHRTMSYVLVEYIRRWIVYEVEEAKQPKIKK